MIQKCSLSFRNVFGFFIKMSKFQDYSKSEKYKTNRPPPMMTSSRYYSPSGKFNVFKLVTVLLLLFPLWIISFLYAALLHWNPITFLSPIIFFGYAIIIGQMVINGINVSNTQNKNIVLLLGIVFSFSALYFSWANFIAIWQNSYPIQLLEPETFEKFLRQYFLEGAFSTF